MGVGRAEKSNTVFLTRDIATCDLLKKVDRIAPSEVTVLILGESGTGKEVIARILHERSARRLQPMISVNCGALHDNLLLSELFGHEKGAFTGATHQKKGLVEIADGGTLFLDEIGEMGLEAQSKLLRFLQEGEIYRVGGKAPIYVNVRVLSATNRDLEAQVQAGQFREDLFYRINTFTLSIPPLRTRRVDIPLLIEHFLAQGFPSEVRSVQDSAMKALCRYDWPGNVRELQNVVERFKVLVDGNTVRMEDLPFSQKEENSEVYPLVTAHDFLLDTVEKRHIQRVLRKMQGNKTRAAQAMGITVKTLYNKLARYGLEETQNDSTVH